MATVENDAHSFRAWLTLVLAPVTATVQNTLKDLEMRSKKCLPDLLRKDILLKGESAIFFLSQSV